MFTPPCLIEGVTSSIISPSRRWTDLLLVSKQVIRMGIHRCNTYRGSRPTRGAWLPAICQVAWLCFCLSNWIQSSLSAYRNGILSRWITSKNLVSHWNIKCGSFFPFPREFFIAFRLRDICALIGWRAISYSARRWDIHLYKQWAFMSTRSGIVLLERN